MVQLQYFEPTLYCTRSVRQRARRDGKEEGEERCGLSCSFARFDGVCAIDTGGKKVDTDSDDEPKVVPQKKEEVKKPAPAAKKKKDTSAFAALAGSDEVISCAHTQTLSFTIYCFAPYAV